MSKRGWNGPFAFVALGAMLLTVWSYVIWTISAERQFNADTAYFQSERTQENASAEFERCFRQRTGVFECTERAVTAQRDAQRAEYDLAAQKEMAYWTPWIMLGGLVTAVAAVIGLGAIAYQNSLAREASFQAQRAWLRVEAKLVSGVARNAEGEMRITVEIEIENLGIAPANNVVVEPKAIGDVPPNAAKKWIPILEDEATDSSMKSPLGQTVFKGQENRYHLNYGLGVSDPDPELFQGVFPDITYGANMPLPITVLIVIAYQNAR